MQATKVNRSANAALKGYSYQFNQTLLEILRSPDGAVVTVEGIEDIDLTSATDETVVQCKYFEAQRFSLPGIRDAVVLMLADSISAPLRRYRLYIHCGDMTGFVKTLDLESIKECLTVERRKPVVRIERLYEPYGDDQLYDFCDRLSIDAGESYEAQTGLVVEALRGALGCSEADSVELFAPTARDVIFGLAIEVSEDNRRTTRDEFIARVDSKRGLYTRWHREQVGEDRFVRALKRQIRASRAIDPVRSRMLIVDVQAHYAIAVAASIRLARTGYEENGLCNAVPWTILLQGPAEDIARLKRALVADSLKIHDGFEGFGFQPDIFDESPVVNTSGKSRKISRTSYVLRVLSLDTFKANIDRLRLPDSVFTLSAPSLPGRERQTYYLAGLTDSRIIEILGV